MLSSRGADDAENNNNKIGWYMIESFIVSDNVITLFALFTVKKDICF